jgi:hypothetical protein
MGPRAAPRPVARVEVDPPNPLSTIGSSCWPRPLIATRQTIAPGSAQAIVSVCLHRVVEPAALAPGLAPRRDGRARGNGRKSHAATGWPQVPRAGGGRGISVPPRRGTARSTLFSYIAGSGSAVADPPAARTAADLRSSMAARLDLPAREAREEVLARGRSCRSVVVAPMVRRAKSACPVERNSRLGLVAHEPVDQVAPKSRRIVGARASQDSAARTAWATDRP